MTQERDSASRTEPGGTSRTRRLGPSGDGGGLGAARQRAVAWIVTLISIVTTVVVLILAVHIVFVAFDANTGNALVHRISGWADDLAWQFRDVFQPENHKAEVAVNYGLAAVVYLVIGRILVALVRRVR
ncbi:hypothetical protein [Actinomadura oligospora]|uniref:hypothetical protein n=1 Tax=Actinomadura oligospora TaxID=111804 RepID=UPI0004B2F76E|nr:hypothetical protein [Actinomadura oligospora]